MLQADHHWLDAERVTVYPRILVTMFGLAAAAYVATVRDLVDFRGQSAGADFITFWAASYLGLSGRPQDAYDVSMIGVAERIAVPAGQNVFAWFYPPPFFLAILPLALMPYLVALLAFVGTTLIAYLVTLGRVIRRWDAAWLVAAFPGIWVCLAHGQTGFLTAAGRPAAWPVERVLAAKVVLVLLMGGLGFFFFSLVRTPLAAGLGIFLALLGFFFPDLRLYSVGVERRQAISLQLPDTLDQMSIAVQAGLGFDAAMIRVARNGKGALANEMIRAMQDIQVGQPRRVAYADLGERSGVPELRRFMRAIVQAETYGLALADVLHTQADEMRIMRRQRAEMKAMEIPVKVVFPLILCIMPAMFIVLVGPAGIRIAEALAQLNG